MTKEISTISPEGLELANLYLTYGNIDAACRDLGIPKQKAVELMGKREVRRYIDTVYMDLGYRNRNAIGNVLDTIIASKLEEAEETGIYSSKDLADLLQMAHKMRMDEIKLQQTAESVSVKNQTNVQINDGGGQGNYGRLIQTLLADGGE